MFRSLYDVHAFNGDPHPGNYLFHGSGQVTFLDFGLVKHFTLTELQPLMQIARQLCVRNNTEAFRQTVERAGHLRPDAPLSTDTIVEHMAVFYDTIRKPGPLTIAGKSPPRSCAGSWTCAARWPGTSVSRGPM